ncbi:hypothetical protein OAS86_01565 [Gammaproteobacteria bacterium]|nr:hypothetical protein [Gammaproteobacteria bacterium]
MSRAAYLFVKSLLTIVTLLVASMAATLYLVPGSWWQWSAERAAALGGVELEFAEPLRYQGGLAPEWTMNSVRIGGLPGLADDDVITVDHARIALDLATLVDGHLTLRQLRIEGVDAIIHPQNERQEAQSTQRDLYWPRLDWLYVHQIDIDASRVDLFLGDRHWPIELDHLRLTSELPAAHQLSASLAFRGQRLVIGGDIPAISQIGIERTAPYRLQFSGVAEGSITGDVGARELRAETDLMISNLGLFSDLAGLKLPALGPWQVQTNLAADASTVSLDDLNLQLDDRRLQAHLSGSIADLQRLHGLNLRLDASSEALQELVADYVRGPPVNGSAKVAISARGDLDRLSVDVEQLRIDSTLLSGEASGQIGNAAIGGDVELDVQLEIAELSRLINHFSPIAFDAIGAIDARGRIVSLPNGGFAVRRLEAELVGQGLEAKASGEIGRLDQLKGFNVQLDAGLRSLADLDFIPRMHIMDWGPITATALLVDADHPRHGGFDLALEGIVAEHRSENSAVDATGSIGSLLTFSAVDIGGPLRVDHLGHLQPFTVYRLPAWGPVTSVARFSRTEDGGPYVVDVEEAVLNADGIDVLASGQVGDASGKWAWQIDARGELDSLQRIADFLPEDSIALPDFGPFDVQAHIDGVAPRELAIEDVVIGWSRNGSRLEAQGRVDNATREGQMHFSLAGHIDQLQDLKPLLPITFDHRLNANVGADLVATYRGPYRLEQLDLVAQGDDLSGTFSGGIDDLVAVSGIQITSDIKASKALLEPLLELAQLDDQIAPGETNSLRGRVTGDRLRPRITGLQLRLGENQIDGDFALDLSRERPEVSGSVQIERLRLQPNADDKAQTADADEKPARGRLFPDLPVPFAPLRAFVADLTIDVGSLTTPWIGVKESRILLRAANGHVVATVGRRQALSDEQLSLTIDGRSDKASVMLRVHQPPLTFGSAFSSAFPGIEGTPIQVHSALHAEGRSIHGLLATLNGNLLLEVSNARARGAIIDSIGSDFIVELLRTINPFRRNDQQLTIECAVINAVIEDGTVASSDGIVLRSDRTLILGSGSVDLNTEKLRLVLSPKPREGLGLNATSVARFLAIGGTLGSPSLTIDPGGLIETGASIGAAIATGGWSLLAQGIYDRVRGEQDQCQTVREMSPASHRLQSNAPAQTLDVQQLAR